MIFRSFNNEPPNPLLTAISYFFSMFTTTSSHHAFIASSTASLASCSVSLVGLSFHFIYASLFLDDSWWTLSVTQSFSGSLGIWGSVSLDSPMAVLKPCHALSRFRLSCLVFFSFTSCQMFAICLDLDWPEFVFFFAGMLCPIWDINKNGHRNQRKDSTQKFSINSFTNGVSNSFYRMFKIWFLLCNNSFLFLLNKTWNLVFPGYTK